MTPSENPYKEKGKKKKIYKFNVYYTRIKTEKKYKKKKRGNIYVECTV